MQSILILFTQSPAVFYLLVAIFSLCIGSFLNVVIYRTPLILQREWQNECQHYLNPDKNLPKQETFNLSLPASHCPQCQHALCWYHNIPLVSWLLLAGKCYFCKKPIGVRYPLVELLTLICSLCVAYVFGPTLQMLAGLIFTWTLITLSFIDFDSQLLPDRFTLPLAAAGLLLNSFTLYTTPSSAIWGYVVGFLSLWSVYMLFKLLRNKEGMGFGDFKLLAALGAWLGLSMLPLIILLSSCVGAIIGMILLKIRKADLPFAFGPYLAAAGWIALLWGDKIMAYYLSYAMP